MKKRTRNILIGSAVAVALAAAVGGSYAAWNGADPAKTCARCHEVAPSHEKWLGSAHADVTCIECHGTALESLRSFGEKSGMVVRHFTAPLGGHRAGNEEIVLSERQVLDISARCGECHRSEHAAWAAGGHSATYADIFEDPVHNAAEKPYEDCFRCHGMFFEGGLARLIDLSSDDSDEWKIADREQAARPTMPCLACHQIHTPNPVSERSELLATPRKVHYERPERAPKTALYVRADKASLNSQYLTPVKMQQEGEPVRISDDPTTKLCMQCHSPDFAHRTGSMDDRTPTGVHEGLSCASCHKGHDFDTRSSCMECHPALSNCGIDVAQMNTTFLSPDSPNDIHHVSCTDCHATIPRI